MTSDTERPVPVREMRPETKKALQKTIRSLRERLLRDLHDATEGSYKLSLADKDAKLSRAARVQRARFLGALAEGVRALPKAEQKAGLERLRVEAEKDAAFTLLLRLLVLRLFEALGLRKLKLVTGGYQSAAYKQFRELAPDLVQDDPSDGYATLLALVYADLSTELPGLYGTVRLTQLVPIPPATLRAVLDALNDPELDDAFLDDTTLGWVYQYWNDPEREALDKQLNDKKKLQNHEIASKTQMFTERYMVEWLLHNTLGTHWLALCRKNGWTARVEEKGPDGLSVLTRLDARRAAFRKRREAGQVPLDALMPIEGPLEAAWKYWVPQPIPNALVTSTPTTLDDYKLLDPACGSGHFLVIALGLLFELHREEGEHRGLSHTPAYRPEAIVTRILAQNLYGIDIDPRAVQLAAAALLLKARMLAPAAEPHTLNLVAPALSLGALPGDDPALLALYQSVERETGLPHALTEKVVHALAGADHLGTLLKVDGAIEAALRAWEAEAGKDAFGSVRPAQGRLFEEQAFAPKQLTLVTREEARETLLRRLERFLAHHSGGEDLGLRLRGEQLAAGVRFVRMVREGQYDLVVGNPPYQGTSKMADAKYVAKHYPRGKADLFAAFLERGLELAKDGGVSALLTMRNWMFIKQYAQLREWLLSTYDLRLLGDVDRGAFDEVPNEVLAAVMSVFRRAAPGAEPSIALQPTPLDDKSYDRERTKRKRAALLCQVGRHEFEVTRLSAVPERPVVYWWDSSVLTTYRELPKFGQSSPARPGLGTRADTRLLRHWWEPSLGTTWIPEPETDASEPRAAWVPYIKGAAGQTWYEPLEFVVKWAHKAFELYVWIEFYRERAPGQYIKNGKFYFQRGVAFTTIGNFFAARIHRFSSVFGEAGASVFADDLAQVVCVLNSRRSRMVLESLNPTVNFKAQDINRLPVFALTGCLSIAERLRDAFSTHESHREPSVEFRTPGPSPWRYAQAWAQRAVDRPEGEPLPPYEPELDPEPPTDHVSFALGAALGRFGAHGEGVLDPAAADLSAALPHGVLYLSALDEDTADSHARDGLAHVASAPLRAAWQAHGAAVAPKESLRSYLRTTFFDSVHRKMYENRPIHFPLSSKSKSFVAYANIHRFTSGTLRHLLAEYLIPEKQRLEGLRSDLREARTTTDKKLAREADGRLGSVARLLEELDDFIAKVTECAEKGPPPSDPKCPPRERDARYAMDLDDGVMINAAALWPLLEPQWKDPKKWWRELASCEGKKDYDWAHLSARYFPRRVYDRCKDDPSLAVAHGCFWKLHPENAYKWELRLQDEIGPEFKLDEAARGEGDAYTAAWVQESSDVYRAAFEAAHPAKVEALVAAETKRREKKRKKGEGEDEEHEELGLSESGDEAEV